MEQVVVETHEELSSYLRNYCIYERISTISLAYELNLSEDELNKILNLERKPSYKELGKIQRKCGVVLDRKGIPDFVVRNLITYGNTIVSKKTVKSLGEENLKDRLIYLGLECRVIKEPNSDSGKETFLIERVN